MISVVTYAARWILFIAGIVCGIYCAIKYLRTKHDMPVALILLDVACALPVAGAPIVLFGSIFLLDNPDSVGRAFACIALLNSYSLFLIAGAYLSFKIYARTRRALIAALPPLAGLASATAVVWATVSLLGW